MASANNCLINTFAVFGNSPYGFWEKKPQRTRDKNYDWYKLGVCRGFYCTNGSYVPAHRTYGYAQ